MATPSLRRAPLTRSLRLLPALLAACASSREPARVASVAFLPEIAADGARDANVLYQDGALPTPVPGGTLWSFGDTFLGTRNADGSPAYSGNRSNTLALLPAGERSFPPKLQYLRDERGVARAPLALLAGEDEKTRRLWPLAGVHVGARCYMFYALIDLTGPGPWGFRGVGVGLARSDTPFAPYERLQAEAGWPIDASAIVANEEWLYLYAPRRFHGEKDLRSGLLIARVRVSDIEAPARYEFFAACSASGEAKWTAHVEQAAAACEDVWGQASVAWNERLGAYLLATSSNLFHHDQIQLRSSPTPWGPWSPLQPDGGWITVPERKGESTQLIYCTMLHPELDDPRDGTLTLTFCRMLRRDWAFTNPEAVRIGLARD